MWPRAVAVGLALTCALTQTRSQAHASERREQELPRFSVFEDIEHGSGSPTSAEDISAQHAAYRSHTPLSSPTEATASASAVDQALLARIAKLELLDAKLSQMDVLEKVFNFVQLDTNMARISDQVDRISERLNRQNDQPAYSCPEHKVGQQLAALDSRLHVLEKSIDGVAGTVESQLDRLHSQLDSLLEKNVQLNTKTDTMREAVSLLLRASEVADDQLEQTEDNLRYLRDELELVKQKTHSIHHQQRKSETALKEAVRISHKATDSQVQRVERSLEHQLNIVVRELTFMSHTIWRATNESKVQHIPDEDTDYLEEIVSSPLEDANFRIKFVSEIRSAVMEDSKKLIRSACPRSERQPASFDLKQTSLLKDLEVTINKSLERAAAAQFRPADCSEVHQQSTRSGIFTVYPNACSRGNKLRVYCDMETAGGGWTVIQRRGEYKGSRHVDFFKDWSTYKWGFGNLTEEFYLGNELIHLLTTSDDFVLRIEMEDFSGDRRYAEYQHFSIDGDSEQYRLNVGRYSGNAGDGMTYHNGMRFTTRDKEHDTWPGKNCAAHYRGGWWFGSCHKANLNGVYLSGSHGNYGNGIIWYPWRGYYYSLRSSRMMVRPRRVHQNSPTLRP